MLEASPRANRLGSAAFLKVAIAGSYGRLGTATDR